MGAATRFIFQIGQVKAVLDSTSILELDAVLNPPGDRRTLRSTTHSMMTPTRIRELIQEQKKKHKEQQDTVSKLQQELTSLVDGENHHQVRGHELELELELELKDLQEEDSGRLLEPGNFATEEQGKKNKASGAYSVVNGGEKNKAKGDFSVIGGGLKNSAFKTSATIGGGSKNTILEDSPFSFIGGRSTNQIKGKLNFIGGGEGNKINGDWASIPGGYKNMATGDYATAMGWNALAEEKLSMAIGLQVDATKFVRGTQVGDWILRAELIEFRILDKSVVLKAQNIRNFQNILKGTRRRRMDATSKEEQTLLIELEEFEELVDYQEIEIEELEGDIQDFHRDHEEANEI